jgi:hypothetical protein
MLATKKSKIRKMPASHRHLEGRQRGLPDLHPHDQGQDEDHRNSMT